MQQKKKNRLWLIILCDFLMFALMLSVFCYFHHIRKLWGPIFGDKPGNNPDIIDVITKPNKQNETTEETTFFETSEKPVTSEGEHGTNLTETEPIETDPPETEPLYDKSGDFGYKFYKKFSIDDTVDITDTYYKSKDIYLTITEVRDFIDGKNVLYYVYDVYVRNIENLFTSAKNSRTHFTDLVWETNAIAAISGDYWGNDNKTYVAIRNGQVLRSSDYIVDDICVLYWDGTMETIDRYDYDYNQIIAKAPYQLWQFGPALLDKNGNAISSFDTSIKTAHPRSSIGYYEPGHYAFIVCDGRSKESGDGVTLKMLAKIYESLGCVAAYNLDGGDSAFAYYDGEVLRQDYDRSLPGQAPRKIYDIIGIGEIR